MIYTPDNWKIVRITSGTTDIVYKVFAGWAGSYTQGRSWKANSGIKSYTLFDDRIEFLGYSGSIYRCYFNCEGLDYYTQGIVNLYKKDLPTVGSSLEEVDLKEYLACVV